MSTVTFDTGAGSRRRRIRWRALRRSPALLVGLTLLFVIVMAVILAPVISPNSPDTPGPAAHPGRALVGAPAGHRRARTR